MLLLSLASAFELFDGRVSLQSVGEFLRGTAPVPSAVAGVDGIPRYGAPERGVVVYLCRLVTMAALGLGR